MLGIIVLAANQDGEINPSIYEKIGEYTIYEHTMLNALKAEHAHKVVAVAPRSERRKITGGGFLEPRIRPELEALKRRWLSYFGDPAETLLDSVYFAAQKNEFDDIIVIHANCPLIPTWLINSLSKEMQKGRGSYKAVWYNTNMDGMWICGLSYAAVADLKMGLLEAAKNPFSRQSFENIASYVVSEGGEVSVVENEGDDEIIYSEKSLVFDSPPQQLASFTYMLEEQIKGAEINELIEDLNVEFEENEVE